MGLEENGARCQRGLVVAGGAFPGPACCHGPIRGSMTDRTGEDIWPSAGKEAVQAGLIIDKACLELQNRMREVRISHGNRLYLSEPDTHFNAKCRVSCCDKCGQPNLHISCPRFPPGATRSIVPARQGTPSERPIRPPSPSGQKWACMKAWALPSANSHCATSPAAFTECACHSFGSHCRNRKYAR